MEPELHKWEQTGWWNQSCTSGNKLVAQEASYNFHFEKSLLLEKCPAASSGHWSYWFVFTFSDFQILVEWTEEVYKHIYQEQETHINILPSISNVIHHPPDWFLQVFPQGVRLITPAIQKLQTVLWAPLNSDDAKWKILSQEQAGCSVRAKAPPRWISVCLEAVMIRVLSENALRQGWLCYKSDLSLFA